MSISKRYFWVLLCTVITMQAWGQVTSSPFTQYGIGDSYGNALANSQGMAGLGISLPQYWYINNQNPALLIYNSFSTFQAGLVGESKTIRDNTTSEKHKGGNMNYLVMAFPVKPANKWTTSAGLMPYSRLNYKFKRQESVEGNTASVLAQHEGSGGLTQLYWSNGVKITKNLSLGLKASYIFGTLDKISKYPVIFTQAIEDKNFIKGFNFSFGAAYHIDSLFGKDYRLNFGVVYGVGSNLRAQLTTKSSQLTNGADTIPGSAVVSPAIRGRLYTPGSISGGISITKGTRWSIGTEYSYQNWANLTSVNKSDEGMVEAWKISAGAEFTPDAISVDNFLKRITYRIGASTEQYPVYANNKKVIDNGINFGFSVPTGRSSIDLGFRIGKRGSVTDNILEEKYFRIFLGFTFNDQWFIKRKFD